MSCRGKILKALTSDETRRDSIIVVCKEEEQDSFTHWQGKEVIGNMTFRRAWYQKIKQRVLEKKSGMR